MSIPSLRPCMCASAALLEFNLALSVRHPTYRKTTTDRTIEPKTYSEGAKDLKWIDAMNKEHKALEENKTWTLTLLPPDKKAIGCKWVYRIKFHSDGTVERYKARLVAQGFTEQEGIDYTETFALVTKMVSVRTLLVIDVHHNWQIAQLDINNAFLHGYLHEEVSSAEAGYRALADCTWGNGDAEQNGPNSEATTSAAVNLVIFSNYLHHHKSLKECSRM
ncbi:reverse transcriptase, RNA-dependent DNA polymerase, LTR copia-type gag-polypeptide [Tanacetum coccineum]